MREDEIPLMDETLILLASLRRHRGSRDRLLRRFLTEILAREGVEDAVILLRLPGGKAMVCRERRGVFVREERPAGPDLPLAAEGPVREPLPKKIAPRGDRPRAYPVGEGSSRHGALLVGAAEDRPEDLSGEEIRRLARFLAVGLDNVLLLDEARRESRIDPLTGLFNYKHLNEQLRLEIERARRFGNPLSILLADLDRFKSLNDRFGHPWGNEALHAVGRLIGDSTRTIDTAAKYGGDDFSIILPNTDRRGACRAAERLVKNMRELRLPGVGDRFRITLSVGVASFPEDGTDVRALIRSADEALDRAKGRGGDSVAA